MLEETLWLFSLSQNNFVQKDILHFVCLVWFRNVISFISSPVLVSSFSNFVGKKSSLYLFGRKKKVGVSLSFQKFQSHFLVAFLSRDNNGILKPLRDVNCRPYWLWNSLLSHTQTHNTHIFLSLAFLNWNTLWIFSFHPWMVFN